MSDRAKDDDDDDKDDKQMDFEDNSGKAVDNSLPGSSGRFKGSESDEVSDGIRDNDDKDVDLNDDNASIDGTLSQHSSDRVNAAMADEQNQFIYNDLEGGDLARGRGSA